MSSRHSFTVLLIGAALIPLGALAQQPRTVEGARAAALVEISHLARADSSSPIVADSAELWRRFVRCNEGGARPRCELVGAQVVRMLLVQLTSPTTARTELRYYRMTPDDCGGPPVRPPHIELTRTFSMSLAYADGRWAPSSWGVSEVHC